MGMREIFLFHTMTFWYCLLVDFFFLLSEIQCNFKVMVLARIWQMRQNLFYFYLIWLLNELMACSFYFLFVCFPPAFGKTCEHIYQKVEM